MDDIITYWVYDGLRSGLCRFCGPVRVALVLKRESTRPGRVYDYQGLLEGKSAEARRLLDAHFSPQPIGGFPQFGAMLNMASVRDGGLLAYGSQTGTTHLQVWFVEDCEDVRSTDAIFAWVRRAAWRLAHDLASPQPLPSDAARYEITHYAREAVRESLAALLAKVRGSDTQIPIHDLIDTVCAVSTLAEEGKLPTGSITFVEPESLDAVAFEARLAGPDFPLVARHKHVRKLLQATERGGRTLVSDGTTIHGFARPEAVRCPHIRAVYAGRAATVMFGSETVADIRNGALFAPVARVGTTPALEDGIRLMGLDSASSRVAGDVVGRLVRAAQERGHGAVIVLQGDSRTQDVPGHCLAEPVDLREGDNIHLAMDSAQIDGALFVTSTGHLLGFGALLDGPATPRDDRARGARHNSSLRFTAAHHGILAVTVSEDGPLSVFFGGQQVGARHSYPEITDITPPPSPLII